ncbi:MAG: hypothetical protein Q9M09_06530, partial [Mariprofundaceae bacterium]|nr:hypothetical protein [Mariprofundaceae bacterium]
MSVPVALRKARKAVSAGEYEEAALVYTVLMARDDIGDLFDIRIRHAYCVEKTGHANQAVALYKGIGKLYREAGETGAAESIDKTVESLEKRIRDEQAEARAEVERVKAEAEKIKAQKIREAKAEAERIQAEAERIKAEKVRKAKAEIERL